MCEANAYVKKQRQRRTFTGVGR